METRQRLETWPVFDAEFGPTTGTHTVIVESSPIPVSVKRRREPTTKFHVRGLVVWPRQS